MSEPNQPNILWFRDIGLEDRPQVGGKGASLGELVRAEIPIPDGFVVTTSAFNTYLADLDEAHGIRQRIVELDPDDLEQVNKVTLEIRELIEKHPLSDSLSSELSLAYKGIGEDKPVAVRSSATSEDSEEASFAGLQDTYLWVKGSEQVIHWVRKCWASLYSPESVSYRLRLDIPEEDLAMGVVVQTMVNSRCSGVMFTRSPTT